MKQNITQTIIKPRVSLNRNNNKHPLRSNAENIVMAATLTRLTQKRAILHHQVPESSTTSRSRASIQYCTNERLQEICQKEQTVGCGTWELSLLILLIQFKVRSVHFIKSPRFSFVAQQPNSGLDRLVLDISRSLPLSLSLSLTHTHTHTHGRTPPN
jgi:hypothetical protein